MLPHSAIGVSLMGNLCLAPSKPEDLGNPPNYSELNDLQDLSASGEFRPQTCLLKAMSILRPGTCGFVLLMLLICHPHGWAQHPPQSHATIAMIATMPTWATAQFQQTNVDLAANSLPHIKANQGQGLRDFSSTAPVLIHCSLNSGQNSSLEAKSDLQSAKWIVGTARGVVTFRLQAF